MMKSTQKSSPNDASARSEKTTEIQAKGAGLQCLSIFTEPFDSARHCALQTSPPLGRVCFAGFPVAFSFTLPPARRSRLPGSRQAGLRPHPGVIKGRKVKI